MPSVEQYAALPRSRRLRRLALTADQLQAAIARPAAVEDSAARPAVARPAAVEDSAVTTTAIADSAVLSRRPAPHAWAPVEIVCHLRDTEEWFLTRCRWAIAMDAPVFPRNNPDRWAEERQYLRHDCRVALQSFRRWREESLEFFASLSESAWARGGVHLDSRGRRTIDEFLSITAWHDDNHLDQLVRALDGRP